MLPFAVTGSLCVAGLLEIDAMSRAMIPSQQKVAEKLSILNDRGVGMLTRIYNIKKACSDAKSKPSFLSEKSLESTLKQIVRKFPNVDAKSLQSISSIRTDIIKSLSLYYFTFVDLLDFKDHVCELLTTIDALQIQLDITLNFDLAKGYLDLVSTYVSLMILLSRVDDRKAVLGLFNAAHEQAHNQSDPSFPRLGNMIIEYDPPAKLAYRLARFHCWDNTRGEPVAWARKDVRFLKIVLAPNAGSKQNGKATAFEIGGSMVLANRDRRWVARLRGVLEIDPATDRPKVLDVVVVGDSEFAILLNDGERARRH